MSDEEAWARAGSIGRPLMFTEARVVDEGGQELPADEVASCAFAGRTSRPATGENPDATAAARDADGWFHTGDMARCDADGFFYIAGRAKDMFISGGVNVYPAEIENSLAAASLRCADAAVVGVPHRNLGRGRRGLRGGGSRTRR